MAIVSLRIWRRHHSQPQDETISLRPDLSVVPLAHFPRTVVPYIDWVSFCIYRPLPARLQLKRWSSTRSVPGREAPDPAPVDPVLPAPDPAALRGPVAALRDCIARAAAQEEQGAGVRLIGLQAFVSDEAPQIFNQHRTLPHRINARLGIQRRAIADREDLGMRNAAQRLF